MAANKQKDYYVNTRYADAVDKVVACITENDCKTLKLVMENSVLARFRGTGVCPFSVLTPLELNPVHACILFDAYAPMTLLAEFFGVGLEGKHRHHGLRNGSVLVTPLGLAVVLQKFRLVKYLAEDCKADVNAAIDEIQGAPAGIPPTAHPLEYALATWNSVAPIEVLVASPRMNLDSPPLWRPRFSVHARKLLKRFRPSQLEPNHNPRFTAVVDRWNSRHVPLETFLMVDRHDAPPYRPPTEEEVLGYSDDDNDEDDHEAEQASSSAAAANACAGDDDDDAALVRAPAAFASFFRHRLFDRNTIKVIADYVDIL